MIESQEPVKRKLVERGHLGKYGEVELYYNVMQHQQQNHTTPIANVTMPSPQQLQQQRARLKYVIDNESPNVKLDFNLGTKPVIPSIPERTAVQHHQQQQISQKNNNNYNINNKGNSNNSWEYNNSSSD